MRCSWQRVLSCAVALASLGVGCSATPADAPDYEMVDSAARPTSDGGQVKDHAVADQAVGEDGKPVDQVKTYEGTLAITPKTAFGGGPYCKYEVTLHDVSVVVTALAGRLQTVKVHDTVVEDAIQCAYAPSPPSPQDFSLASPATSAAVVLTGAPTNSPKTSLNLSLTSVGDAAAGYETSMTWKRLDFGAPLDWEVTAKVILRPK